jgi:hypothetical protein
MRIGIVGAGQVGSTLGRRFAEVGHEILYGVRDAADPRLHGLLARHPGRAAAVALEELASPSDAIVLAVPFAAVEEALRGLGALHGKVLIDATNPLAPGLAGLVVGRDDSGGETVARLARGARVVKAFNTIGVDVMADPLFGGRRAMLTVCSDDPEARRVAGELAAAIGFEPVDFGPLANARVAEPLALAWIWLAHVKGEGTGFAFTLARREA